MAHEVQGRCRILRAFDRDANAFPCHGPRSLSPAFLDGSPDPSVEHEMFAETVATGAATEFSGFLRIFRELPNFGAILLHPSREPLPDAPAAQYAMPLCAIRRSNTAPVTPTGPFRTMTFWPS